MKNSEHSRHVVGVFVVVDTAKLQVQESDTRWQERRSTTLVPTSRLMSSSRSPASALRGALDSPKLSGLKTKHQHQNQSQQQ